MLCKYSEFILEYKNRGRASLDIEDFSDLYIDDVAKKFNTSVVKKLGMGSFGIAYLTKNNKVLKVTTDRNEAKNVLTLKEKTFKHFLNYYGVFEMTLDGEKIKSVKPSDIRSYPKNKKTVYFILMDYIKPIEKRWKQRSWDLLSDQFFNRYVKDDDLMKWVKNRIRNVEDMLVTEEFYKDVVIPYFQHMIDDQRKEMIEEGRSIGVYFKDAHAGNLGEGKDGTLVYFDIGFSDRVIDLENEIEHSHTDIETVDFENNFKKIKNMITSKYEMGKPILIQKVISDISNLLNINKVKAYKYLRDEVFKYYDLFDVWDYDSIRDIYFSYKPKDLTWEEFNEIEDEKIKKSRSRLRRKSGEILPTWKKDNNEIFVTWTKGYKEKDY
jgi:hypothetical protein